MTNTAVQFQALTHVTQVNWAVAFVNLHRVPAAQGDMRTALSGQVHELPLSAGAAVLPGLAGRNLRAFVSPQVVRKQGAPELPLVAN